MEEARNIDDLIAAFYDLETSIHFDERLALPRVAKEILHALVKEHTLTDRHRELIDNICMSDLSPGTQTGGKPEEIFAPLLELGLRFGVRHWQEIAAGAVAAGDLRCEYLTRSGNLYQLPDPEQLCARADKSAWIYDLCRLRNKFSTIRIDSEDPELAWQSLFLSALESPLTFGEEISKRKSMLKSDPGVKMRVWLLSSVIGFESERISIQNPVNIIRNHINKRSDEFQTVLLANITETLFRLASELPGNRLIPEVRSLTDDIRKLRRLDELYLATAALNRILRPTRFAGLVDALIKTETLVWSNPHETFVPTTLTSLLEFSVSDFRRKQTGSPWASKVIFGLNLVAVQMKVAFNMQISKKSTDALWDSLATLLDQTPPEIAGIMHKLVQFGFESFLPPPVQEAVRRNYLKVIRFKDVDPLPAVQKFNAEAKSLQISSVAKEPFALGSIGQLFAAESTDGRQLVIKIKKPDIERMFRDQIKKARRLRYFFHTLSQSIPYDKVLTALEGIWLDECNYELEHESHAAIADIFRNHEKIKVPELHSRPNPQYLVVDRVNGESFTSFVARAGQEAKTAIAALITESVFVQMAGGKFNYDIHPGNYLIDREQNLHLIDFGGILDNDMLVNTSPLELMRLIENRDLEGFRKFLLETGFYTEEHLANAEEKMAIFRDIYFKPFFTDANLLLNEKYVREIVFSQYERELKSGKATCSTNKSLAILRFYWSFYSIIAMLTPTLNFHQLLRSLEHKGQPLM